MMQLNSKPAGMLNFQSGSIDKLISRLSRQLGVPFYLAVEGDNVAVHQWHAEEVQLVNVEGESLKAAIQHITEQYHWHFSEDDTGGSWRARHDYSFGEAYPLVTKQGDIKSALMRILEGYPLNAQLLYETRTVFIVDEN